MAAHQFHVVNTECDRILFLLTLEYMYSLSCSVAHDYAFTALAYLLHISTLAHSPDYVPVDLLVARALGLVVLWAFPAGCELDRDIDIYVLFRDPGSLDHE